MKKMDLIFLLFAAILLSSLSAQPWQQNDALFNPSGIPSLSFSQPRFADLDDDGDQDLILGNINDAPYYFENTGTMISPTFLPGEEIFSDISFLDAEIGVCFDLDGDGDLDFVSGGFTGLNFFENTASGFPPVFEKIDNFFAGLNVGSYPVPDLADIDSDGDYDLVVGLSENGSVKIYYNVGSASAAQFSEAQVLEIGTAGLYAYPNFCDLDADNDQDILVGRDTHGFIYYRNEGDPVNGDWQVESSIFAGLGNETYWNSPDLVDLNGDNIFDLVFGSAAGPLNYYINNGTSQNPAWQLNTSLFGGVLDVGGASNPVFFDFDDDGDLDLISGSNLGDIKYFTNTGTSYAPAWEEDSSYFSSIDHSIYSAITIGDVNGDGLPDAIVGDLSGNFYYHQNNGSGFIFLPDVLSFVNLGGWSCPRLVDMDFDDDLDIIAGNENGNLFYFENQGTPQLADWVEIPGYFGNIDVGSNCVPSLGDLDLDGDLDVVTGDLQGQVQFFENLGSLWNENPFPVYGISGGQNTAPAFVDLDGDGDLDLCLGNYGGTFNYFENLHPNSGTGNLLPPTAAYDLKNYPNPFNPSGIGRSPSTTISFNLSSEHKETDALIVNVYNLKGQKVKSLPVTEVVTADNSRSCTFSVVWDGTDQDNQPVSSGIYLYQLRIDNRAVASSRMLLLR